MWYFSLINTHHRFQETKYHHTPEATYIHHGLEPIPSSLEVTVLVIYSVYCPYIDSYPETLYSLMSIFDLYSHGVKPIYYSFMTCSFFFLN